jgi:hypothetical protein
MNLKTIFQGFGAATVILILRIWPHLSKYHPVVYHSFLPLSSVVWGVLIDLGVLTILAAILFRYLLKKETGLRTAVWAFVAASIGSALVTELAAMRRSPVPYLNPNAVYFTILFAALLLRWVRASAYRRAVHVFGIFLMLAGCSMVWMVPELLYQALRAQPADARVPETMSASASSTVWPGERIIWLLFDELSYDQTFEHRVPRLSMPAFDSFRSQSVVFTHLEPAGYYTDRVVPSFLLGKPVGNIRSNLDGDALVQFAGSKDWVRFDPQTTIFADAQRLGWTTGVVGWYNPYCRILQSTLNYCFWQMGDGQSDGALPDQSPWQNAIAPLAELSRSLRNKPGFAQEKHAQDAAAIMPQARALIADEQIRFALIHLPVPHPPGIYDREHGGGSGSYIDNLALADQKLAELMQALNGTSLASKTTIIVCSDHSWRVPLWRSTGAWTKEDEMASKGRFDPRPVLMIHFPDQQMEQDVSAPMSELRIHEMLEALLRGAGLQWMETMTTDSSTVPKL